MPFYIEQPGNLVPRLPFVATDALMHCALVSGDMDALQKICDQMLNGPTHGKMTFKVVTSQVLLTSIYVPHMTSGDIVDGQKGYMPEIDIGFWILTFGGPSDDILNWGLRWLPVYLFVDSGAAMAGGREIFGYPKSLGRFTRTSEASDDPGVTVDAMLFRHFSVNSKAEWGPLFQIAPVPEQENETLLGDLGNLLEDLVSGFQKTIIAEPLFKGLEELQSHHIMPPFIKLPMVFLKQFRDVTEPNKACFQTITEVAVVSDAIHDGGFFSKSHTLEIFDANSHPISRDLGIKSGQELSAAFWLRQDFSVGFGSTLWASR